MKPWILIILLFTAHAVYAQTDSLRMPQDTVTGKVSQQLDSLQQSFTTKSDSIKQSYTAQSQKIGAWRQLYLLKIDSLKTKKPTLSDNPADTLAPVAEVARYQQKVDSLDNQLASVQQKTTAQLEAAKQRVTDKLGKLKIPKQAQGKASALTIVMDKANVPSFDTDIVSKLGSGKLNLPGSLPNTNLPGITVPDTNLPNVNSNLPGTGGGVPGIKNNLSSSPLNTDKLSDITGEAGDIQKQVQDATGSKEALGKTLEDKAAGQVKGLPSNNLPEQPGMPGVPKTGDEAKEQLKQVATQQAVNHFAGKEAVLAGAMDKMSKYKQKYSSVSSLKDIESNKRHNELKGKSLIERLVPSVTMQFQSWQDLMLDVNPAVGYRFTSHLTAGIGYNHRIAFNIFSRSFNREARVSGFRSYGEYNLKKGLGFRLDIEMMNTPLKKPDITSDASLQRDWVWSAFVGIKQKYPIYKKLKGNAQLMYNLFDRNHRSPYTDRINFRIGMEFTIKKKKEQVKSAK